MAHGQILGLFNGVVPLLLKDLTFVMCKFAIFDITKQSIYAAFPEAQGELSSALLVSLAAGSFAGMISSVTSQPGDYIFSKASERKGSSLKGALDAYLRSGRYGDILTGLQPRMLFGGALIALQFVIYDYCRVQFHVSPDDLKQFFDVMADVSSSVEAA